MFISGIIYIELAQFPILEFWSSIFPFSNSPTKIGLHAIFQYIVEVSMKDSSPIKVSTSICSGWQLLTKEDVNEEESLVSYRFLTKEGAKAVQHPMKE